ncbi:hypothetical protein EVAR_73693_1 [Eumeta japonica]|uniref:Uncharacterized protein n=1 Tax=Eumeta variegata TaxID=151549 RepID=A0A4C1SXF8_EUMVA|nr:hypothetical protein EVAR_73693_1 [Eumeta japonica]
MRFPYGGSPNSTQKSLTGITCCPRLRKSILLPLIVVVEKCGPEVLAYSDRLPVDVFELIRPKNAAVHRSSANPTAKCRFSAQVLQCRVRALVQEVRNENWSDLMEEITPAHKAFWKVSKALKIEGYIPIPTQKTGI